MAEEKVCISASNVGDGEIVYSLLEKGCVELTTIHKLRLWVNIKFVEPFAKSRKLKENHEKDEGSDE